MNNSYENLPEEYENDGNTYCHGIVNCKYYHEGCNFMYMGSGDPDDMPCRVQEQNDLKAFLEWREKQEQAKELEERPQGEYKTACNVLLSLEQIVRSSDGWEDSAVEAVHNAVQTAIKCMHDYERR